MKLGKASRVILVAILSGLMLLALSGCGSTPAPSGTAAKPAAPAAVKTIKIGFSAAATDPRNDGAVKFKEIVERDTKGAIKVEIYPAAQLGNDRDLIEGVKLGTVQVTVSSAGNFANYEPKMGLSALPFLFPNAETAWKFLDTPQVKKIEEGLLKSNIRVLSNFENGFRCVTNSKKVIEKPEDLKGLTLRTPENPYVMETLKALGANPSPLPWSEVYIALQQKMFDGQENPIPVIYSAKIYEVQKYLSITNHSYDAMPFVINEPFFKTLTPEQQAIVKKAAIEGQNVNRQIVKKQTADLVSELEKKGMTVSKPDLSQFKKATLDVFDKFSKTFSAEELDFAKKYK